MSYSNFEKAMMLTAQCKNYKSAGPQSEELLRKVETAYGFKLSRQHREYLKKYGYILFYGTELYGIYDNAFKGIYAGNAIVATLQDRKKNKLPKDWIPIYDYDDGYVAYLDYTQLNEEEEPQIIVAVYTGDEYKLIEVIATDLGDFILSLVQQS